MADVTQMDMHLRVKNVAKSAEWYQRMLGMKVVRAEPDKKKPAFARLRNASGSGPAVMLSDGSDVFTGKPAPKLTTEAIASRKAQRVVSLYFSIDGDIKRFYTSVKRKGAKITQELADQPYGMTDFAMRDPDGYQVGVGAETKPA